MNKRQLKIEAYKILEKTIGRERIRSFYLKECIRRYKNVECIFIHIPKAGRTSVAISTIGKRAVHFTASEIISEMGKDLYDSFFSFSITLHPIDRVYSVYNYIKNGGGSAGGVRKESYFGSKSFRSFNSFILEWLQFCDLHSENILFKPQTDFIFNYRKQLVNYIGKIEDSYEVSKELSTQLNKYVYFGKLNKTRRSVDEEVSVEAKNVLKNLYKKDFELLNYS